MSCYTVYTWRRIISRSTVNFSDHVCGTSRTRVAYTYFYNRAIVTLVVDTYTVVPGEGFTLSTPLGIESRNFYGPSAVIQSPLFSFFTLARVINVDNMFRDANWAARDGRRTDRHNAIARWAEGCELGEVAKNRL